MNRNYEDLKSFSTFLERFEYLKLGGGVGITTFGFDRYLNQMLYKSERWKRARNLVIIRDEGCDLGIGGHEINSLLVVHHMNPIKPEDIENENDIIFDPRFLISASERTHRAIHYGDISLLPKPPIIRLPNDTVPWR